jgi:hypothetical protein
MKIVHTEGEFLRTLSFMIATMMLVTVIDDIRILRLGYSIFFLATLFLISRRRKLITNSK